MLSNNEIQSLVQVIGTGIGEEFDLAKLRYNRIIVMTDADVDGAHIRTLILTFLYRHMQELFDRGHVYIAVPPLYLVKLGQQETYLVKDAQLEELLVRERFPDIEIASRDGAAIKLTEARYGRFQRALARVRGLVGSSALRLRVRTRPTSSSRIGSSSPTRTTAGRGRQADRGAAEERLRVLRARP